MLRTDISRVIEVSQALDLWCNRYAVPIDQDERNAMIAEGWNVQTGRSGHYLPVNFYRSVEMRAKNEANVAMMIQSRPKIILVTGCEWTVGKKTGLKAYLSEVRLEPRLSWVEVS